MGAGSWTFLLFQEVLKPVIPVKTGIQGRGGVQVIPAVYAGEYGYLLPESSVIGLDGPFGKYYNSQNKLDYLCLLDSRFRGMTGIFSTYG